MAPYIKRLIKYMKMAKSSLYCKNPKVRLNKPPIAYRKPGSFILHAQLNKNMLSKKLPLEPLK